MANKDAELREAYNEQMFERRANGLGTVSFEDWKYHQERIRRFIEYQTRKAQHG